MHWGKLKGKAAVGRTKLYFARDRADGKVFYFDKAEGDDGAKAYCEDYNANKRRRSEGIPPTNKALKKETAEDLIRMYMRESEFKVEDIEDDELVESCELQKNLAQDLIAMSTHKLFEKKLFDFTSDVAEKWRDQMLNETYISHNSKIEKQYSPDTIQKKITTLQNAWVWGRKNVTRFVSLENPWKGLEVPGTGRMKQRGLNKGELEKLLEQCKKLRGSNRYYTPLAINLAVETGMRRQEILGNNDTEALPLTWKDIDFKNRTIFIKHDKNSHRRLKKRMDGSRKTCLPPRSHMALKLLHTSLLLDGCTPGPERFKIPKEFHPPNGWIFMAFEKEPMTGDGFKQTFDKLRAWAGIVDEPGKTLTPHCLRAEAKMSFHLARLDPKEIDIITNGPKNTYEIVDKYLEGIQPKLEEDFFGMPWDEIDDEKRDLLSGSYPQTQGMSLEDIAKLPDNWLFDDAKESED